MDTEIDTRVTISLHPNNVEALESYDEYTAPVLAPVAAVFDTAYQGIASVHAAREKVAANPSWTEAQQVIKTQDMADAVFAKVAKAMDGQRASLAKGIAFLEKELTQPVESRASHPISKEIREHIKSLPKASRMGFIKNAIDEGDHDVPMAALGAPSFLSGIDASIQSTLLRMYREKSNPQLAKRLRAMQQAKDLIETRSGLLHSQLEAAVGMAPHKVQRLRKANSEAEAALILKMPS